ncbi:TonB-dependent receptor plug domain-containing protein [Rheinheimera nanhaiensis]|uniref:Iron complex outermembrane recepter protein n=1 Tax=Rheinheimera nanhaiensis E407-8 TaxID=562729 RepID=I1DYU2_9GAMM|nr:TonB-dependent receptor [Rheinheimera nanhaiensis]GAB59220.1 iron complex outermembrane recepter protein [Rheinheimera nanhaiensis E407-8]
MKNHNKYHPVARAVKFGLAASLSLGISTTALAQEESPDNVKKEQAVEKIAVVGTRSAPRSIGDSPVPVDIIGGEELNKNGNSDMLNLISTTVPSLNVHSQPISDAATLIRPINLRGLSSDSTLVLLNGKRRHRASVISFLGGGINDGAQGPDLSVIPGIALKQVEVLRDGAAAQYGSDAIAGVVNFVLKDAADGGTVEVKHGEYYAGDGTSTEVAANVGMPLTKDGFVNVSMQYKNVDATSRSVQRADAQGLADGGNPFIQDPAQVWGSPKVKDDITLFANAGLDLGNGGEAYIFGNYSERDVRGGFYYRNPTNRPQVFSNDGGESLLVVDLTDLGSGGQGGCQNIPLSGLNYQQIDAAVQALPDNCFTFFSMFPGGFTPNFGGNITDTSLAVGTKGEFKTGFMEGILYDFSGVVGRSESNFQLFNSVNASLGPETPTDFDAGKYIQLEKTFSADFVKYLPAGLYEDLTVAFGAQWTEESFEIVAGEEASWEIGPYVSQGLSNGSNGFPGFQPQTAGTSVRRNYAAYVDVEAEFTENLLGALAVRFEDYDSFGTTTNYKLTGQYRLTDDWALRASTSTGFRAPTVGQANVSNVRTEADQGVLVDIGVLPATNPVAILKGATELQPEESTSYAFGVVYTGYDFFVTADYYRIDVDDRISQSSPFEVTADDIAQLKAAGVRGIDSLTSITYLTNDFDTRTQGLDIVANYSMDAFNGRTSLALAYNWNDTEVTRFTDITGEFRVSRLEKDLPNHRATFTVTQSWDDWSAFLRTNYYGSYQGVHADDPGLAVRAQWKVTLDAEVSYYINDNFIVSAGAQNLLDNDPEEIPDEWKGFLGGKYFETSPMGINGGYWYLKGTYKF